MNAIKLGQEFFCFSFVIEDSKRVSSTYLKYIRGFRVLENNFSS